MFDPDTARAELARLMPMLDEFVAILGFIAALIFRAWANLLPTLKDCPFCGGRGCERCNYYGKL